MSKTGHKTMMAFLAGLGCDVHAPAMTCATPMHLRPMREEEERAARERCDRQDALDVAEEKRKRKNAKRLSDAKKVGTSMTAALSRQVACTDGLGVAVPPAPTFENGGKHGT